MRLGDRWICDQLQHNLSRDHACNDNDNIMNVPTKYRDESFVDEEKPPSIRERQNEFT